LHSRRRQKKYSRLELDTGVGLIKRCRHRPDGVLLPSRGALVIVPNPDQLSF
jgi:hypothetical protein